MFATVFAVLFLLVFAYLSITSQVEAAELDEPNPFEITTMRLVSNGVSHTFTVELAVTQAQHHRGLMYRQTIPPDTGMVFDFGRTRPIVMWMKDTPASLDMLFADENQIVVHVAHNTTPLSRDIIQSPRQARYVVELAGGTAARLGIGAGWRFELD
ncbi:MAG: DUF192 domain-containing protein [Rhodospirillaceae bacterium]|nr:DUF192 domain-containing protein [Rhodospirillaceae bacterium]